MAIWTRQPVNGRMIGIGRIVGVAVGTFAIGAALVAGGLGWQGPRAPQTGSTAPVVNAQPVTLGIALPYGADIHELPAGLRDYIRAGASPVTVAMEQHPLGIDLPQGADAAQLPRGLTDYVRPQPAELAGAAPSAVLGITLPSGTKYSDLPGGVTDYLRAQP